ncbi:hypothetical protein L9F63_000472, partial [Diploptera punctata]
KKRQCKGIRGGGAYMMINHKLYQFDCYDLDAIVERWRENPYRTLTVARPEPDFQIPAACPSSHSTCTFPC